MWPTGGRRVKCLFITLLRRFDGTRGKQTRVHSLPREEKRGEFERELLMRLDLKYKFSAICNLMPARFLWDSRTRLKARQPLAWGGGGKRYLFRGLVVLEQLWYIIGLPRNVISRWRMEPYRRYMAKKYRRIVRVYIWYATRLRIDR